MTKGRKSEVGADAPTDGTKQELESLVDGVLSAPALPKSTLPKEEKDEAETGLDKEQDEGSETGDSTDAMAEEESDESSEEEVIPASKHKKALENMQKRIDSLTQKIKAKEVEDQTKTKTQEEKLSSLSERELQDLRDNVDDAIIDAKVQAKTDGTDASERISSLRQLRREIDRTVKEAPRRFAQKQVAHLEQMINEVKDLDPGVENKEGELWNTAVRVFQRMPSLRTSETGQAEALAIAAEYFLEKQQLEGGREKANTLSKKVANLKRKTTLDSKTRSANADQVSLKNIKEKALKGNYWDKLDYVKRLVPDDFLQPQ